MNDPSIHYADPALLARLDQIIKAREHAVAGSWADALHALDVLDGINRPKLSQEKSMLAVKERSMKFIEQDDYLSAGTLLYPEDMFKSKARHVQRIFDTITKYDKVILMGASNLGKSYNAVAWLALDYIYDPYFTTIRAVSVSETNNRDNVWRKIISLIGNSLFPLDLYKSHTKMVFHLEGDDEIEDEDEDVQSYGFRALLIGRQETSNQKVKGYHCDPFRKEEHPRFGKMTRVRLMFDEAQGMNHGITDDFNSPLSSIDPDTHVMKFIVAMNPTDTSAWALQYAEPPGGWMEDYKDSYYEWESGMGWHVCRVDSARTENIVQRKKIFAGFPLPGAEKQFFNGTEPLPSFDPFWRGWPPAGTASSVILPPAWFDDAIGEPTFTGIQHYFGAFDVAEGGDKSILCIGRYGVATGWRDKNGDIQKFNSRSTQGETENRRCTVVDQLIELTPGDPATMGQQIIDWCTKYRITPEHFVGDKTGNGGPRCSWLDKKWGQTISINWKNSPSKIKILADDNEMADSQCKNIISEMGWTVRMWMQPTVKGLFINPVCKSRDRLKKHLTTRRYTLGSNNMVDVEEKNKWAARYNQESPDEGDTVFMLCLAVRRNNMPLPATSDESAVAVKNRPANSYGLLYEAPKPKANTDHTSDDNAGLSTDKSWVEPGLSLGREVSFKPR